MTGLPERLEVGRVVKPHGLRGEVVVDTVSNRSERLEPGSLLFDGARPLCVLAARPHGGRWLVAFDGVADRDAAEALRGAVLTGDRPGALPEGEVWVH